VKQIEVVPFSIPNNDRKHSPQTIMIHSDKNKLNPDNTLPRKRRKKDPNAPKRNPSAFLIFSKTKRRELQEENPSMKNTEISRLLGKLWREMPEEEKFPHKEREQQERKQYKIDTKEWKERKKEEENFSKVVEERTPSNQDSSMHNMYRGGEKYYPHNYGPPQIKKTSDYNRSDNNSPQQEKEMWYGEHQQHQLSPLSKPQVDPYASEQYPKRYKSSQQREEFNRISPIPFPFPKYLEPDHYHERSNSPMQYNFFPISPLSSIHDHQESQQQNHHSCNGTSLFPSFPRISSMEFLLSPLLSPQSI